ncbi:hypothetical protein [Mumia sp. DW29H23]|uniref:hypothetical protein n=1 Tax=Mumia sp. DW29H23 TaxID=3421241 RepID=UPI003D68F039
MNNTIRVIGLGAASALVGGVLVAGAPTASADDVNIAPLRTIKGPVNTQLSNPLGVYVGANGKIHVSNFGNGSITVFGAGANGDVPPERRLAGGNTGISAPRYIAADSAGFTWLANSTAVATNRVLAFGPTADGNVAPDGNFNPGFTPFGIVIDKAGKVNVSNGANEVRVFPTSAAGSPAAERTITSTQLTNARGLAVDGSNRLWVANGSGDSVVAFAPGASGNATPVRQIKGPSTQIQFASDVAVDSVGRVYVADETSKTIKVFGANANGDVAPLKSLGGPAAALNLPAGVAIGAGNAIVVADYGGNDISTFKSLFAVPVSSLKVPGKPRALKVAGARGAKTRKVTWRAPAFNGGAKITGYRLVVKKGSRTLLTKNLGPNKRSFKLKRSKLRNGKNVVFVKAKNVKGFGKNAKKSFRVRK